MIRQALRPDHYKPSTPGTFNGHVEDTLLGPRHITHCLNQIRQSIMCHGDITPYVWQWNETLGYNQNMILTPHHGGSVEVGFDYKSREINDPLDPKTWVDSYTEVMN
jgi:hypothetical protein